MMLAGILSSMFKPDLKEIPTPADIVKQLNTVVIGQTKVKVALAVAVYNHYKRRSGKTMLVKTLAKCIKMPLAIADATSLTAAGYVAGDVESVTTRSYFNAEQDVKKCQRGIVYIDEVDKLRKVPIHWRDAELGRRSHGKRSQSKSVRLEAEQLFATGFEAK
jgi:ATP-dependent protease Clp ATPase subunit